MNKSAIFDKSMKYRYSLSKEWDQHKDKVVFIMLNPSIADDEEEDKTTRRCIYFAEKFGYGSLEIVNLFAYITPYPRDLKKLEKNEAIGNENYKYINRALISASMIIAAWGENATIHQRHQDIEQFTKPFEIYSLGSLTKEGHP